MTQSGKTFTYTAANIADTDLDTIDDVLDDLTTSFSGGSSPSNGVPGMVWYDTTKYVLRHADHNAGTWRAIFAGSAAFKIWAYLDAITAEEGWARDSSVTDVVLGLKSTSGVYVTGAQVPAASSWTISGLTKDAHTHANGTLTMAHTHTVPYTGWPHSLVDTDGRLRISSPGSNEHAATATKNTGPASDANVDGDTGAQSNSGITSDGSWRIRAAVGIMVYPNI